MGWALGAAMNIAGSILINCGTNIMKLGHTRSQKRKRRFLAGWYRPITRNEQQQVRFRFPDDDDDDDDDDDGDNDDVVAEEQGDNNNNNEEESRRLWWWNQSCTCCMDSLTCISTCPPRYRCESQLFSRTWLIGMVFFASGNVLNFVSFSYAAQSLLAALGSVQFITNVFFAHAIIQEPIRRRTILGTTVLIIGVALVVRFSCHGNPATSYSLGELEKLFVREPFVVYMCVLLMAWIISFLCDKWLHSIAAREDKRGVDLYATALGFSYAAVSAIVGAQSVTFFKILSELITIVANAKSADDISKKEVLSSPFFYGMILASLFAASFWIYRLNHALEVFDAMFIVPLFQVFWMTLSVIGGGIFFREFEECFHGETAIFFVIGLMTIFSGVFLLSPRPEDDHHVTADVSSSLLGSSDLNSSSILGERSVSKPQGMSNNYINNNSNNHSLSNLDLINRNGMTRQNSAQAGYWERMHEPSISSEYVDHAPARALITESRLRMPTAESLSLSLSSTSSSSGGGGGDNTTRSNLLLVQNHYQAENNTRGVSIDSSRSQNSLESSSGVGVGVGLLHDHDEIQVDVSSPNSESVVPSRMSPLYSPRATLNRSLTGMSLGAGFGMPMLDAVDVDDIRQIRRAQRTSNLLPPPPPLVPRQQSQ